MTDDVYHFGQFMKQREQAARAYVSGNFEPLGKMVTHASPATFFGPAGGVQQGPELVRSTYQHDATRFMSGETHFEVLHMAASDGVAYWVGFQHATVQMDGSTELRHMQLRVTEVFRREGDEWKLVHRHADMQAPLGQERERASG